jgi:protein-S-isoprenylcysteine O-methyltransferase Ste14
MAAVVIAISIALLWRIDVEEGSLRSAFGSDYVSYSKSTHPLIPGFH